MSDIDLSPCQALASEEFMDFMESDEKCFVLTGGPGRGKSFLTKFLIDAVKEKYGKRWTILCAATTNKAAAVLEEHVDRETSTIHSLLKLRVKNNFQTGAQFISRTPQSDVIHKSLIVIDEASMEDTQLSGFIEELTANCKILRVGDADQLAPVNEPFSPAFYRGYRSFELETVMRQKGDSGIIALANQLRDTIRTGKFLPLEPHHNGNDVEFVSGAEFQEIVNDDFSANYGRPNHGKIIAWTNDRVNQYNEYVRGLHTTSETFEPDEFVVTNIPVMTPEGTAYATDSIAMITDVREDELHGISGHWYELDGGIEVFQPFDRDLAKRALQALAREAKANPKMWKDYFAVKEDFADLRAVHSCTAHKSQGSTYDVSYIDLDDIGRCRQWETVARLLYVAVTRARKKVVFYGSLPEKYQNGVFTCVTASSKKAKVESTELPF